MRGFFATGMAAGALAAMLLSPTVAKAEVTTLEGDPANFLAHVSGMPDLDQSRDSVYWDDDRNNGRMYCGPTAAANVLNYLANNGYPEIAPGAVDLEPIDTTGLHGGERILANIGNALKVGLGDHLIADLADRMGTDPSAGTGHSGMVDGLRAALPSSFRVQHVGERECSGASYDIVNLREIFDQLEAGNLVIIRFGYYEAVGSSGRLERTGGHWVTPTGLFRSPEIRRLWWADPARDEDGGTGLLTTQSDFVSEVSDLSRRTIRTRDCSRRRWQVVDRAGTTSSPDRVTVIEDMIVITPPGS